MLGSGVVMLGWEVILGREASGFVMLGRDESRGQTTSGVVQVAGHWGAEGHWGEGPAGCGGHWGKKRPSGVVQFIGGRES